MPRFAASQIRPLESGPTDRHTDYPGLRVIRVPPHSFQRDKHTGHSPPGRHAARKIPSPSRSATKSYPFFLSCLRENRTEIVANYYCNVPRSLGRYRKPDATAENLVLANMNEMGLLKWTLQILDGLIFLRSRRIVKGGMAAWHVLFNLSLNAKLCAFGMAHQVTRESPTRTWPPPTRRNRGHSPRWSA